MEVSNRMPYSYSLGDEHSSSNYRPNYCSKCDADSEEDCICNTNNSGFDSIYQQGDKCKECSQDHRYHPDFSRVQTSIDIISELLGTQSKDHIILSSEEMDPDLSSVLRKVVKSEDSTNPHPGKAAKGDSA
jgi:hypothetical protein